MLTRQHVITFIAGIVIGALCGFFLGRSIYHTTEGVKVERDTILVNDTIPDYHPAPKDSATIKWVTRWLPSKADTVTFVKTCPDSVFVEVPITSKHYGTKEYDAWVSGYEPNLDSIYVYREKEIITETITKTIKENKPFSLGVTGGCEYQISDKVTTPFAGLKFSYNGKKFGAGVSAGYRHNTDAGHGEPYVRANISYNLLSF